MDESSDTGSENSLARQIKALAAINERLLAIRDGTQKYTAQPIELKNIAHSQFPIRTDTSPGIPASDTFLEVTLIVLSPYDDDDDDDGQNSPLANHRDDTTSTIAAGADAIDPSGRLRLIRVVNDIPMLDTQEALGCGLINKVASARQVWFSFGLDVRLGRSSNSLGKDDTTPTLEVQDSHQILPFLARGSHEAFHEPAQLDDDEDSSSSSMSGVGSDVDDEDHSDRRRRRNRGDKASNVVLPARVRFANTLMVVHVHGKPSTLPLPTLSKVSVVGCYI